MENGLSVLADVACGHDQNDDLLSTIASHANADLAVSTQDGSSVQTGISSGPSPAEDFWSPDVFMTTLKKFHKSRGTELKHPIVGGKTLDFHHLFLEVTDRGGFEQVLKDGKWKDVVKAFNFPKSCTSATTALRHHYENFLLEFEQAQFNHSLIPTESVPETMPKCANKKRHGDLNQLKRNKSAYNYFVAENFSSIKSENHRCAKDVCKIIGPLWTNLPEAEKQVYKEKALRDKERYKAAKTEAAKRKSSEVSSVSHYGGTHASRAYGEEKRIETHLNGKQK